MKIRVLGPSGSPEDLWLRIFEFGFVDVSADGRIATPVWSFVNTGHPISAATRDIHHISDADVAGAMHPTQAAQALMLEMEPGDMFAAHNFKHTRAFFGGEGFPWICTLQCARHLLPDMPSHANQVLRYCLGVDEDEDFDASLSMPPHRAGPDAYVTAFILRRMLRQLLPGDLVAMTSTPVLLRTVAFGKHRGQKWEDVPTDYLHWLLRQDMDRDVMHTARTLLEQRGHGNG